MAYMHIDNLYKSQDILAFKECYAMEKIHGSSAHVSWRATRNPPLTFFAGGCKHADFLALFDEAVLMEAFKILAYAEIVVFGEVYGGKLQGMSATYGKTLKFIAFEVKVGESWLSVPDACEVATGLGFEFVHFKKIPTTLEAIDAERDAMSVQAARNGIAEPRLREGIVLRPLIEVRKNNGERIIAKHKSDVFAETKTPRKVVDPSKLVVLQEAEAIAQEWVTEMRLAHVLDGFGPEPTMQQTGDIIQAMFADVEREASGEVAMSKDAKTAIGRRTAKMFKARLEGTLALYK